MVLLELFAKPCCHARSSTPQSWREDDTDLRSRTRALGDVRQFVVRCRAWALALSVLVKGVGGLLEVLVHLVRERGVRECAAELASQNASVE